MDEKMPKTYSMREKLFTWIKLDFFGPVSAVVVTVCNTSYCLEMCLAVDWSKIGYYYCDIK